MNTDINKSPSKITDGVITTYEVTIVTPDGPTRRMAHCEDLATFIDALQKTSLLTPNITRLVIITHILKTVLPGQPIPSSHHSEIFSWVQTPNSLSLMDALGVAFIR